MAHPEQSGSVPTEKWQLTLYVAGMRPADRRAEANLREICNAHLPDRHGIEVVDIVEHPERAEEDRIFAVPAVVRHVPAPWRRVIGDLSDRNRALAGIGLVAEGAQDDR